MLSSGYILINKFVQGFLPMEELLDWFDSLDLADQRKIIGVSMMFLQQSHPNPGIFQAGIDSIPLKPTMTPIILLKTQSLKIAFNKIEKLPDNENRKSFIALVSVFKVSDTYRRETWCKDGCGHEWHNLSEYL